MHRRLWLWQALLRAALTAAAAWPNASGTNDPLSSGSPDTAALTTPGPSTSAFPWTGTDSSLVRDVQACESAKRAWYTSSSDWYWASHSSYSYTSVTTYDTVWLGNYTGPLSTFCDGVPRASGPAPTTTTLGQIYVNSLPPPFPSPSPTCTFNYRGCELVVESYRSWYATSHPATVDPPAPPLCEWGPDECIIPYGEDHCRLDAGEVKLIFWPHSKDPADLCATNGAPVTAAPSPTTPVLATSGDYTFTSPTVYLSFKQLQGLPCYKTWSDAIVPVPSTAISSLVFGQTDPIERTTSMNWQDMNSPVPLSAYKAQQSCWDNWLGVRGTAAGGDGCNTIYDDYLPWLALPTNPAFFTAIDPLFGNCTSLFWRKYVFDPPYFLTPVGDLLPPTPTAKTTDHTALSAQQPSATAMVTIPVKTTIAQPRYGAGPIATVGSQTVSADPHNPHNIVIAGETMVPGQISAIGTAPIIVRTGEVVIGSSTIALPISDSAQPVATVASQVIAADGQNFILPGGKTLTPGQVTVINRVTVSVASSALVVGGGSTVSLPDGDRPVATFGSQVISADGQNFLLPGGKTLTPGQVTVIDGATISAASSALVVGGSSTISLPGVGAVLSVGSRTITAQQATPGLLVIGTQTISAGGSAATVSGVTISAVGKSSVVAVVDGTTTTAAISSFATRSSGDLDATTSVPGLGWATEQPTSEATTSTKSAAAALRRAGRTWTTAVSLALMVVLAR
ncbi:hypothetical protein DIS24_g5704 [Lasiodiplodia hormozganensis]|uniref:Uncharacterized protein n=1 Tax=Lasiodiplodia hormozganensis TaxID=869390 RepID=A0AA40CX23_9PEZI|nr:hypothetical protein DIS24_g5704 [Lasiodiplodia hormozganensis]